MKAKKQLKIKKMSTGSLFLHGGWGRSLEEFIKIARMKYGDYYSYERVVYRHCTIPVEIICPEHGPFSVTPIAFFNKDRGCPHCGHEAVMRNRRDKLFARLRALYGEKYRFDGAIYIDHRTKLRGICPEHGEFWQKPDELLHGHACPQCGKCKPMNTARFLRDAKKIHGEKYDYSQVGEITGARQRITIVCPVHGPFTQSVLVHIYSAGGCQACAHEQIRAAKKKTWAEFLKDAWEIHGDKYRYDQAEAVYADCKTPVPIICPVHGVFMMPPYRHAGGGEQGRQGCPACGWELTGVKKSAPFAEFLRRAREVHGDKYQYDEASYSSGRHKLTVICPVHGGFTQRGSSHLDGVGCPACGREAMTASKRTPFAEFVRLAREAHGDKYTYDEASYTRMEAPLKIVCPEHGEFIQRGSFHLRGRGCPACLSGALSVERRMPFAEFLRRAREKHGDRYQYDEASWSGMNRKLTVTCPVHGRFSQTAGDHLKGYGCTACSRERGPGNRLPFAEFLRRAREAHGDTYQYDEGSYSGIEQKLTVICPVHGPFSQKAGVHLKCSGCPVCAQDASNVKKRVPFAEFLRCARKTHGNKYRYDEGSYSGLSRKVTAICPVHGPFSQNAGYHMRGCGCPVCARRKS